MWLNPLFTCFIFFTFAGTAHCLTCMKGYFTANVGAPTNEVFCDTRCGVERNKYSTSFTKNTWKIGCMDSTKLSKCGTSGKNKDTGSTNAYCCCNSDKCNNYHFAWWCHVQEDNSGLSAFPTTCNEGYKQGSQNPIAPTEVGKTCTGQCYVELKDFSSETNDRWTYGCQTKGYLKNCGEKEVSKSSYKRTTCCCEGPECNTLEFAESCAPKTTPAITSAPKTTPAITSAPKTTPAITSAPKTTPAITSAPKTTPAITSAPKTTPVITSAPKTTPAFTTPKTTPAITAPGGRMRCYIGGSTGKNLSPNSGIYDCSTRCYVASHVYSNSSQNNWQYGCMSAQELKQCGKTIAMPGGSRKAFCCCNGPLCNTHSYGNNCWTSSDTALSASSTVCNAGSSNKALAAPTSSKTCIGQCYVEFYDGNNNNDRWTYGCRTRSNLKYCGQSEQKPGYTNNICCCEGKQCNTLAFAQACAPDPVMKCKTGTSMGSLVAPNGNDVACSTRCFVSHIDHTNNAQDVWTYGCLGNSQTRLCNTTKNAGGSSTKQYCCCDGDGCNDRDFANEHCSSSIIYRISVSALLSIALLNFFLNN